MAELAGIVFPTSMIGKHFLASSDALPVAQEAILSPRNPMRKVVSC